MPLPLPQPRAMFVAALAMAAAVSAPIPAIPTRRLSPSAISRANVTLRRYLTELGRGIVAAGRAQRLFRERGAMWAHPQRVARMEARARAIAECPAVIAAIGEVLDYDQPECAWVELSDGHVSLLWRGELIVGERQTRAEREGRIVDVERRECSRMHSPERFAAAVAAAAQALDRAGFPTSGLTETRWLQISPRTQPGARRTFAGYVATIGLKRRRPVWLLPPNRSAAHVR